MNNSIHLYSKNQIPPEYEQENDYKKSSALSLLLCAIGDPHNLGAILRSAYYLGVDKVYTTDCSFDDGNKIFLKSSSPTTPVVSKASSGVLEVFCPLHLEDSEAFLRSKKSQGWIVTGSGSEINNDNISLCNYNLTDQLVPQLASPSLRILVIGNEGFGIPKRLGGLCDNWIGLKPGRELHPDVDSLNVSVATALLVNTIQQATPKI